MKYLNLLFLSVLLGIACNEAANKNLVEKTAAVEKEIVENVPVSFGKEINESGALDVSNLKEILGEKDSVYTKLTGSISAVCKKKGCWMTLPLDADTDLRVRFKDYEFFVPLNCEGKTTIMEGWAYKNEVSVDMLRHYAEDDNASEKEIAAITEPKVEYSFMAEGVLLN